MVRHALRKSQVHNLIHSILLRCNFSQAIRPSITVILCSMFHYNTSCNLSVEALLHRGRTIHSTVTCANKKTIRWNWRALLVLEAATAPWLASHLAGLPPDSSISPRVAETSSGCSPRQAHSGAPPHTTKHLPRSRGDILLFACRPPCRKRSSCTLAAAHTLLPDIATSVLCER